MKVRLADIAKEAGVSINTVSAILNGKEALYRPETCERVKAVARQLGYTPNLFARSLRTRRTSMIGVAGWSLSVDIRTRKIATLQREALTRGYQTLVGLTFSDREREQKILRQFVNVCDGLLLVCDGQPLTALLGEESIESLRSIRIPFVVVDAPPDEKRGITVDRARGISEALEALAAKYEVFIYATGGAAHAKLGAEKDPKVRACRTVLKRMGRSGAFSIVTGKGRHPQLDAEAGYEMAEDLLSGLSRRTLVICSDDRLALGMLKRATEAGIRIPDEIGVLGFDDDRYAPFTFPSLSTIGQPVEELARVSLDFLMALVDGKDFDRPRVVATTYVPRESS